MIRFRYTLPSGTLSRFQPLYELVEIKNLLHYEVHLPLDANPSWWHTTLASRTSQKSSHTVP